MSLPEIQALMQEPYLLYDFAPFISVAMAVNFVSSFWHGIKNKSINNLNNNTELFVAELSAVYPSGNCTNSDSVKDLTTEAAKHKTKLSFLSFLATSIGILVVCILFFLLALIGFSPKTELTFQQGIIMTCISILPSTLLRLVGILYSRHAVKQLKKLSQIIKNAAKAAIKDKQQSAYGD